MTYLVDSDAVVDYLRGRQSAVSLLDSLVVNGLAISIITYGEVYEGVYYGRQPGNHEAAFRDFLEIVRVVGVSRAVARRFARISGDLRSQGLLIPAADLLIAATALHHDLALVTRNIRHFERIPGLQIHTEGSP